MAARRFRTLTDSEMASITGRQAAERTVWRNHPSAGAVVACCGEDFVVLPGVFPPRGDSWLLIDSMTIWPNSTVLDMGTGTGVLAVFAALRGAASVVAVDINPAAVENAAANAARHGLENRIECRLSDGFSAIAADEKFDTIIANWPGRNQSASDMVAAAQGDTGFETHRDFFAKAPNHLTPGGSVIMATANDPELNRVFDLAESAGLKGSVLAEQAMQEDDPRVCYVISFSRE